MEFIVHNQIENRLGHCPGTYRSMTDVVEGNKVMRMLLRIIVSLAAGLVGAAAAFGLVALVFYVTKIDPGIGGGLIAIAAAIVALPVVGGFVFSRLSPRR